MPALSRCAAPPALALALGGVGARGFSVSELYEKNYEDPMEGMWCVGLAASGFEQGGYEEGDQYDAPDLEVVKHFHEQGSNCFRVPITWERLQSQSSFGSTEFDPVPEFVETIKYITEDLDDYAIIVPHGDGLRYQTQNVHMEDFVSLWTAIAKEFAQNDRVIFELHNKPQYGCHNGNCGDNNNGFFGYGNDDTGAYVQAWLEWCQGAVDAIRAQSADNYVIVPGLKKSSCRDWTGAQFWGESLDGYDRAGNLRLFALQDPSNRTAYGVQQYFDLTMTGDTRGCEGHDEYQYGGWGADEALTYTIAMAQKYNKKLWMTEVASFPDPDASTEVRAGCESKMKNYLSTMADSGVFLGYQVWQFGCSTCGGASGDYNEDLTPQFLARPGEKTMPEATYNLGWYDLDKYGITSTSSSSTATSRTRTTVTRTTVSTSTCTGCTETSTTATTATTTTTPAATLTDGAMSALPSAGFLAAVAAAQLLTC